MRVCIVYDSMHEGGATAAIAECIGSEMRSAGLDVGVYRVSREQPDLGDCGLVVLGTPIYFERPMKTVTGFIDGNNGLEGRRVAVYITCFMASRKISSPIRDRIVGWYLGQVIKHVRGEIIGSTAFSGWIRRPDKEALRRCREWSRRIIEKLLV